MRDSAIGFVQLQLIIRRLMSLTSKFSSEFASAVRSRGRSYYNDGSVRITQGDDQEVIATVRGSENYRVILSIEGKTLIVSCTCPYFDQDVCKHIWATLLTAEARGLLDATPEPTRLRMSDDDDDDDDDYDDDDDDGLYDIGYRQVKAAQKPHTAASAASPQPSSWKKQLAFLNRTAQETGGYPSDHWPVGREVVYVIDGPMTKTSKELVVEVLHRDRKQNGEWSRLKTQNFTGTSLNRLPDGDDRRLIALLLGAREPGNYYQGYYAGGHRFQLSATLAMTLLPMLCSTGRCMLRMFPDGELAPLAWDDSGAWEFWLEVRRSRANQQYVVTGSLRRGLERREMASATLIAPGLLIDTSTAAPLDDAGAALWIEALRAAGAVYVPAGQEGELLEQILSMPRVPRMDLAEELRFEETRIAPRMSLKVREQEANRWQPRPLGGDLSFDYDGQVVDSRDGRRGIFDSAARRFILRDELAEQVAAERLSQVGFRRGASYGYNARPAAFEIWPDKLPRAVRRLVAEGWHVEAEGKLYRQPGEIRIEVTSGIDWFELHGAVDFGDATASLPALLMALKRGESIVELGDGSFGLLPEEWLKKYGLLAGLGEMEGEALRFTRSQVGLLDALLASQPEATFDATFAQARDALQQFDGVKAMEPPDGFIGELRGYQKEGLGWFHFLQRFGFGGCLADDMGTGKTVVTLALLEARRQLRPADTASRAAAKGNGKVKPKSKKSNKDNKGAAQDQSSRVPPSLLVVPRSLIFNWKAEAARFAPQLRILDHTGVQRRKTTEHFDDYDLIITTYGTLRQDAVQFKDVEFDYVILDEAQAIKNAATASSKAARLLRGRNRLALSGTPVENHLGELWTLFDFLNPGLLGAASVFNLTGLGARNPDEETRLLLGRALRPFILRRTKAQVAKDLPAKNEQTIYCEMEPAQRKLYDELRDHYRRILLGLIDERGLKRAKIQVLEALLRLRQAACHPGLIDKKRTKESSAKLDLLLDQLPEVLDEGHKVLVFSQFTSLLAIVRDRLDKEHITYEYLDGRTRDRAARVGRFQSDDDCKLFLISLKAGGLGLNLTAAEYVFLLDPWWNPAVEAQAIDRAHRIGQTKNVFAYRLIARGTVEEKVLELQNSKRELADAIINADNSLIRSLAREDLELLLS
jgi:superfamily II DNA or RNA helicase